MKQVWRVALIVCLVLFAGFAAWRIIGQMQAERYAKSDPQRALDWRPAHPVALLTLAERQLKAGELDEAEATAKTLLTHEPLVGSAFRILGAVEDKRGNVAKAFPLYQAAARRAPRDTAAQVWLAQKYLERGDFRAGLQRIDTILRLSPGRGVAIYPILMQLSQDPDFAQEMAVVLQEAPPWRRSMLAALRHPKTGNPLAAGLIMQALQGKGGLTPQEYASWLDSLMAQDRWGEAYARWAGDAIKRDGRLPLAYNGDFEAPITDAGFDWRRIRVPGVMVHLEQSVGAPGRNAYIRFLDRRVASAGLELPLFLQPGRYALALRMRASGLRSQLGLQWTVTCAGGAGVVAKTDPIDGNVAWREFNATFTIPAAKCAGQKLRLVNLVGAGAGQRVVGEVWVDDVRISPQAE